MHVFELEELDTHSSLTWPAVKCFTSYTSTASIPDFFFPKDYISRLYVPLKKESITNIEPRQ